MERIDRELSCTFSWPVRIGYVRLIKTLLEQLPISLVNLYGAKLYLMDDGRWLIMDYLNIPDAPRHYIDCIEGSVCNMNVRIISESTKVEIEKNQEMFNDAL